MKVSSPNLSKMVALATSLKESQKEVRFDKINAITFHLVTKIVKIGPVDAEIFLVDLNEEQIIASKIYSPVGKFAKWAK